MKMPEFLRILYGACFFLLMTLSACSKDNVRELSRSTSPDNTRDVIVVERLVGATVSTPYEVFLVKRGDKTSESDLILRIDKSAAPVADWVDAGHIALKCPDARVWVFTNFKMVRIGDEFLDASIALQCGERGFLSK